MPISNRVDKSLFALPEPRRFRDKTHRIRVKQPRLLCRRQLADAHHLADRAASCAWKQGEQRIHLHRPVVMSPHCEVHRCGDESGWWKRTGIAATVLAVRCGWRRIHRQHLWTHEPRRRGAGLG